MNVTQATKSAITLEGSTDIVCEYLDFAINSILFQRGIYPREDFDIRKNYGIHMYMLQDEKVTQFIEASMKQLKEWLMKKVVNKASVVLTNVMTREVIERWDFAFVYAKPLTIKEDEGHDKLEVSDKPLKKVQMEIREVMRLIASSISYLPFIDCPCSFDVLFYTSDDCQVPKEWQECGPAHVTNGQLVKMTKVDTGIHEVETGVVFKSEF